MNSLVLPRSPRCFQEGQATGSIRRTISAVRRDVGRITARARPGVRSRRSRRRSRALRWARAPRWIPGSSSMSRKVSSQWAASSGAACWSESARAGSAASGSTLGLIRPSFLEVVDQLPELVGRERLASAPVGRLADAAIGRYDRQRLGIGVAGDELLDPRVGILIAQGKQNAQPAIFGIEREVAGVHRGIEDNRRLPAPAPAPARPKAHRESAGARGETRRGSAWARAARPRASRCIHR